MKKMKLNVEALAVESFDTSGDAPKRGTVFGEQCTCYTDCTCPGCNTCDESCNGTCAGQHTCGGQNTCGGQATCDATCDTCYYTGCAYSCFDCPTGSSGICGCTV
jgi:hypothetical protein